MKLNAFISLLAVCLLFYADIAAACSPASQGWDRRIRVRADCSFTRAGEGEFGLGEGSPAIDLGNDLVAQAVRFGSGCSFSETLHLIDCAEQNQLSLHGQNPVDPGEPAIAGSFTTSVEKILMPEGPIDLYAITSLEGAREMAREHNVTVSDDALEQIQRLSGRNRYDLFCGCERFYPGHSQ